MHVLGGERKRSTPGWQASNLPSLAACCRKVHAAEAAARRAPLLARVRVQLAHSLDGWLSYFRQPILPSSLTFVLLFFNVVLSPGWVGCLVGLGASSLVPCGLLFKGLGSAGVGRVLSMAQQHVPCSSRGMGAWQRLGRCLAGAQGHCSRVVSAMHGAGA